MKDIRIFVASSKELEKDRNYLAFLVLAHEDEFAARGLRVRLAKWEYVDPKMTEARTEDRYLDEMYNCDAALVLFRDIAGMYTREELDNALAAERTGLAPDSRKARLKAHRILFAADGDLESSAAKLRASLPNGSYGEWTDQAGLGKSFLALVDQVAQCEGLIDAPEETLRTVSAFIAADDELAADRNAFADTVLNLNEILARRGIRVKMRFYAAARHREMLESSEMALVLYRTNCNAFGPDQMRDAYDRTKREENPKRLYVFFRDEDDSRLDKAFVDFKNGFAENLGHFFCRFENADTLKLNFLLSLENLLGEGESFVKLDGKVVRADELEVAEITKLPMVVKNEGLSSIMAEMETLEARYKEQRERCKANPQDDELYGELMDLSVRKNELQQQIDRELSLSLSLARRMATISVAEANDTIMSARAKMEAGRIKEAIEILDGASSSLRRRRILRRAEERIDEVAQEIKELAAGNEVEFFRVDAVMSYTGMPFDERFKKSESIYRTLVEDIEAYSESCPTVHRPKVDAMLADILCRFAKLYDEVNDTLKPIPLLEKALEIWRRLVADNPAKFEEYLAASLIDLGNLYCVQNHLAEAELMYTESLEIRRRLAADNPAKFEEDLAASLNNLGILYRDQNRLEEAERMHTESLEIRRRLAADNPAKFEEDLARSLHNLGNLYRDQNRLAEAERMYTESLEIWRRLAADNPAKFEEYLAASLNNLGALYRDQNRLAEAERMHTESLEIRRRLAADNPAKFEGLVAGTLNSLGILYCVQNRLAEAERVYAESLEILRRLAADNPAKFDEGVADLLGNLGILYRRKNRLAEAERVYRESLEILRQLATDNPAKFKERVASVLNNLGYLYHDQNRLADAERAYAEALEIQRRLAAANPAKFEEDVAGTLNNLGNLYKNQNRLADAERAFLEALEIRRRLAADNPEKFAKYVKKTEAALKKCRRDGWDWVMVLRDHPQFADGCQWEKLDGWDWANLIAKQPQFASHCDWEKLCGSDWVLLLKKHPKFADHCPWDKLSGGEWVCLLCAQPQFSDMCKWNFDWIDLFELLGNPDHLVEAQSRFRLLAQQNPIQFAGIKARFDVAIQELKLCSKQLSPTDSPFAPGIFLNNVTYESGQQLPSLLIIPARGVWIGMMMDMNGVIWCFIGPRSRRKFHVTTLLRAFGYGTDAIFKIFYDSKALETSRRWTERELRMFVMKRDVVDASSSAVLAHRYAPVTPMMLNNLSIAGLSEIEVVDVSVDNGALIKTLDDEAKLGILDEHCAIKSIYKRIRPNHPDISRDEKKRVIYELFLDPDHYDLGDLGRQKINARLGLSQYLPGDLYTLHETGIEVIEAVRLLLKIFMGKEHVDDINYLYRSL